MFLFFRKESNRIKMHPYCGSSARVQIRDITTSEEHSTAASSDIIHCPPSTSLHAEHSENGGNNQS